MKTIDVSIILVNWNCGQVIIDCIESLVKTIKAHTYEIIVVDNNSKDGSIQEIEKKYPSIHLIKNDFNNMFAGANNQGYAISKGKFIFILNSDTIVPNNSVDRLLDYAQNNNQDAMTCTLLNKDNSIQYNMHRGFPSFPRLFTSLFYKKFNLFGFLPIVKNYLLINNNFHEDFYVEQAAGAAILLKKDIVNKIGGYLFDEKNYPLFFNDVDLCYRLLKEKYKILCKTNVKIYHLKGTAINKMNFFDHWFNYGISCMRFFRLNKMYIDYLLIAITFKVAFSLNFLISLIEMLLNRITYSELKKRMLIIEKVVLERF